MKISAWRNSTSHSDGNGYGFRIPFETRNRLFEREWDYVELYLEGENDFFLANIKKKTFWNKGCGEIISKRIGKWIMKQGYDKWERGNPPKFKIENKGQRKFFIYKKISYEDIAYWFFRLNGCFTIKNFILHPEVRSESGSQKTDADLLAVRFPYRKELGFDGNAMVDSLYLDFIKPAVFIVEIKKGLCDLNEAWIDSCKKNINRSLYAMGVINNQCIKNVSEHLYNDYYYDDDLIHIQMVVTGGRKNNKLNDNILQLTHEVLLEFIYSRFNKYHWEKSSHPQWDQNGQDMYDDARKYSKEKFIKLYK